MHVAKNFGKGAPVRINTAPFSEIKVVLGFTEVRALMDYREKNGEKPSFAIIGQGSGQSDAAKAEGQKAKIERLPLVGQLVYPAGC